MSDNFSIFDTFDDVEIDLSSYIKGINDVDPNFSFSNIQPVKTNIKNLFNKINFISDYKRNIDLIYNYNIKEGEHVESTSLKNYKTIDLWWIVLLFNNITNPIKDWPMNSEQIYEIAKTMYEHEGKYNLETYHKFLFDKNEERRNIILPQPSVIPDIIWRYREYLINE